MGGSVLHTVRLHPRIRQINTLLIISHVIHYRHGNHLFAYGPYAREIDIWADLFPEVVIAAPCRDEAPPGDCLPFTRPNIRIHPQLETGGETWQAKVRQILSLPRLVASLVEVMREADAIHVRCPGNLGLLGIILAPLFSPYRIAKYAGQWNGFPGEPWSYRLQRCILRSRWWGAPVTVYGQWPHQPKHVIPFFTSVLDETQIRRAKASAPVKRLHQPLRVLYVGRLTREKNVHILLQAVQSLQEKRMQIECRIVGDGPARRELEHQALSFEMDVEEIFQGPLPFEKVLGYYEWADVLVLVSETEGWPKAIAEGMAFGLVCIGSNRGLVPQMLGEERGVVVEPGDANALASALENISRDPQAFLSMSRKASAWGQRYSLGGLREALHELLTREWRLPPNAFKKAVQERPELYEVGRVAFDR